MKIVRPYAALIRPWAMAVYDEAFPNREAERMKIGVSAMRFIEWCSRISHRSEDAITENSWKRIIQSVVMDHGDWSVVEHVSASVDSITDRGITHESVRHRLFSFTQESTRFVNYEKKMPPAFVYPKIEVECEHCLRGMQHLGEAGNYYHSPEQSTSLLPQPVFECAYSQSWLNAIRTIEHEYRKLVTPVDRGGEGWRPQEARSVFPNALASRIITTGNLRNWRHYFIMRTTHEAHPQMRQVTIPLLDEFKATFPMIFDDILPNVKQSEGMKKAR